MRIVGPNQAQSGGKAEQGWLDLQQMATVEVTSEDASFPIESAFAPKDGAGWRASRPGEQQIRIIFDEPVSLASFVLLDRLAPSVSCASAFKHLRDAVVVSFGSTGQGGASLLVGEVRIGAVAQKGVHEFSPA
jgi:hypothetical protein